MAGLKVKYPAVSPVPHTSASEHLSAREPGKKQRLIRFRDIEALTVHFRVLQFKIVSDPLGDGMIGSDIPQPLLFSRFSPFQRAAGAHQQFERLGQMRGVQGDKAHSLQHPLMHPPCDLIRQVIVGFMAPPDQHVSAVQHLLSQTRLRLIQSRGANPVLRVRGDKLRQCPVNPLGINRRHSFVDFFMAELVPYRNIFQSLVLLSHWPKGESPSFGFVPGFFRLFDGFFP